MIQKQRRRERYFQEDSDDEQECGNSSGDEAELVYGLHKGY
jgi:hypothetical protein